MQFSRDGVMTNSYDFGREHADSVHCAIISRDQDGF